MALEPTSFKDLVEQFVRGSIRRPIDTLGTRRHDVTFTDVQEAAAGVFLLYPVAPFYIAYLASQRVLELIVAEEEVILELLELFLATGRTATPIKDLSPLNNITSALFELERAISNRTQTFPNIEDVSAFKRFDSNVDRFLEAYGRNVKDGSSLVDTPQGARSKIPQLVKNLQEIHEELIRKITLIRKSSGNFAEVNLASISASGVISRSRQVIQQRTSSLVRSSEVGRLEQNLDTVKELLASRALVRRYGSLSRPQSTFAGDITGTPFSDATHPAELAGIQADRFFHITRDGFNVLDFFLDQAVSPKFAGGGVTTFRNGIYEIRFSYVPGGFSAAGVGVGDIVYFVSGQNVNTRWVVASAVDDEIEAVGVVEPFEETGAFIEIWRAPDESISVMNTIPVSIDGLATEPMVFDRSDSSGRPDNWIFRVNVTGVVAEIYTNLTPNSSVEVSWGGDIHVGQLCSSLNTQLAPLITPDVAKFEPYFAPPGFDGEMVITFLGGSTYRATIASGDLDSVGVQSTLWYVKIVTGPDKGKFFKITAVDGTSPVTYVDFDSITGGLDITNSQRVQIGRNPRVKFFYPDQYAAVATPKYLRLESGYERSAAFTLGMAEGRIIQGQGVKGGPIAEDVNAKGSRVSASSVFVPDLTTFVRSVPLNPTQVVLYKIRGSGSVAQSGPNLVLTVSDIDLSQAEVGDYLVYRNGSTPDTTHTVIATTETTITTSGTPISPQSSIDFEVGDVLTPPGYAYLTITIPDGPNAGEYDVTGKGNTVLDFFISPQIPVRQDTGQPVISTGAVGKRYAKFFSRSEEVSASVIAHGSAGTEFFTTVPTPIATGSTPYIQLSAVPTGLQVGDILEYYESDYKTPSETRTLLGVDFTNKLLTVDPSTPTTRTYNISQTLSPPFALLRVAQVLNTTALENNLQAWLDLTTNGGLYFTDLARFVNPLIVNENPTAVQVADARNKLIELYGVLSIAGEELTGGSGDNNLEAYLDAFVVEPQGPVDTLLASFREKGADRAVDILLEANFTGFFGLDVDGSSYAGEMLKGIRDIARDDLPIRKVDRLETQQSVQISSAESEDFEFSGSDTEGSTGIPTG